MNNWTAITLIIVGAVAIAGLGILIWSGIKEDRSTYNNNEEDKHE